MSFAVIRPFFRSRLEALGYTEHADAVDFSNIPSNLLSETFQIESLPISGGPANQRAHEFDYGLILRVFKRGFADPVTAYDSADSDIGLILSDLLAPSVRLGVDIKDIVPLSISKIPLSGSDDNDLIIEFNFSVKVILCF